MFIHDANHPVSAGFWAKGDGRDTEESPGGHIISSMVSDQCVY